MGAEAFIGIHFQCLYQHPEPTWAPLEAKLYSLWNSWDQTHSLHTITCMWGIWIQSPLYHMRSRKQEGIDKCSPQESLAPPLQARGGRFATETKSTGGCIYVWDFCKAILTDPVHHTTQINQTGMLACNLVYIYLFFWLAAPKFHFEKL